jgi:hypothetical protein
MPRKRRRRTTTTPLFKTTAGWQWRSFPVFFAFVCGAFLMGLLNGTTNIAGAIVFYIVLFGVAFGAAHLVTRLWAERRLRSRQPAATSPPTEAAQETEKSDRPPEGARTGVHQGRARRR